MRLTTNQIEEIAALLEDAEVNRREISKITKKYPELTLDEAYEVQWAIRRRKVERGTRIVGMKMGVTSRSKMKQMGINEPVYGFLADYFSQPDGGAIETDRLLHPKVEPELAFITKRPLWGPGCHIGDVLAATDFIMPAVEIIDSRYKNFDFDLVSVVADNTSASRFVVGGRPGDAAALDMRTIGVVLEKNGIVQEVGAGAAVLGHPAESIALLANMLAARGETIPEGSLILSGGITAAIAVQAGDSIVMRAQGLGTVSMHFT